MIIIFTFFALLLIGTPILMVVLLSAAAGTLAFTATAPNVVIAQMFAGMDSTPLLAVPFFIVAGMIASRGKTSEKLVEVMTLIFGRLPGGPIVAAIATCAFFAAISGSSMATVVAVGSIMLPQLKKQGYPEQLSVGSITAGGSIGILIPPSAPMVMFCVALSSSVGKQFMAGFVPGILLAFFWALYVIFVCARKNYHTNMPRVGVKGGLVIIVKAIPALLYPVIVLGSIYAGWATPTESAAISLVYVILLELFLYRTIRFKELADMVFTGLLNSGCLVSIIAAASALSWLVNRMQIPVLVTNFITSLVTSNIGFLLLIMVILMIAGCFVDVIALVVIMAPVILPLLSVYNVDPIHFGIVAVMASQVGYLSPPFGTNLFVSMKLTKKSFGFVVKGTMPFLLILALMMLLCAFFPQICLWLPSMMMS